jgi:hypothetical protein
MLLFYHSSYNVLYTLLMAWPCIYRLMFFWRIDEFNIVQPIILVIWIPIEYARLNFGWRGNIEELFPEIFAFWIFTIIFSLPMMMSMQFIGPLFPHEQMTIWINCFFNILELILGLFVLYNASTTQTTSKNLRVAPIIDKKFVKKYQNAADVKAEREIQLGM